MTILYEPSDAAAVQATPLLPDPQRAATLDELHHLLGQSPDELVVVFGPGADTRDALSFAADQRVRRPELGVILLCREVAAALLADAMRAGIREVADVADPAAVRDACERSRRLSLRMGGAPVPDTSPPAQGRVITVFAGKGGCGKSTIAANLGVALAAGGARRVCVVDLDLAFGDVAIMLQLVPTRSIADAVEMTDELDETGLRSLLTSYGSGLDTLLAPAGPTEGERVSGDLVRNILGVAQTLFDYVIVDTPPQFTDQALAALDLSYRYVVPATPDIPTLKNVRVTLDTFDDLGYPKEHRLVVLNRMDTRLGLTAADIERVVTTPIAVRLPASNDVPLSINRGVPIMLADPGHQFSRGIRQLADRITADADAAVKPVVAAGARKRLLSWRGR